jgi:hypothetical protein
LLTLFFFFFFFFFLSLSLNSETCHKQLMRSVLGTASALQECVVVIALDMSSPWHLLASLRKWLDVLAAFVQQTFDAARLATLQRHISRRFASYVDPTRANAAAAAQLAADVAAQLELGPGTLTHNLGVPIVVTCCKSDYYETLERDFDFTDASFEHIEQALRTVCLEYGAALCYTSASRATNIAELLALIRSGLAVAASSADSTTNSTTSATAAAAVAQPAPLTDAKERVCIPFGFDSLAKIKVGRAADAAPLERFAEALPPNRRALHAQSESIDAATTAEADAEFIARMRAICDAEPAPVVGTGGNAAAAAAAAAAASVAAGATPTAAATLTSAPSAVPAGLSTPVAAKPSPLKSTSTAASVNVSDKGEREVLSDFFNSLMTKTPTKSSTPNSK